MAAVYCVSFVPVRLCQIVTVLGDDDADFAYGAAIVTAGSFRLEYDGETTSCIGCVVSRPLVAELIGWRTFWGV